MKVWTRTSTSAKTAALGGLVYTSAWIAALAGALAVWTRFHAILRQLGPDEMSLFGTVAVTGVTVFAIAGGVLKRVIGLYSGWLQHLRRTWALYCLSIWMLVLSIAYWPSGDQPFEGGNIGVHAALFLAILGVGIDRAISRRQPRAGPFEHRHGV